MTGDEPIERLPTGISGFDGVLLGGLPAGRSALVTGTTGSGKTLLAVEFIARGILRFDQPGVFVTFEETAHDIRTNSASLGFDIERWEAEGKWAFVDASADISIESPVIGTYDFGALVARVGHAVRQVGAKRVAFDSLGAIFTRFKDIGVLRHELHRIATGLEAIDVTSVLTAERVEEYNGISRHGVEEFVLDNVIILRNVLQQERRRRTVEVVKLRGAPHRTGEWLFTIDPQDGLVIIPLAFLRPRAHASQVRVSTGNPELDQMLGGGLYKDSITFMSGPTGTGKTLSGLSFADEAFRRGERCLLYTFDETREQLVRNASGWGYDLEAMEVSGSLRLMSDYPEVASPEDHLIQLRRAIDSFHPHRLVVDPLSALERIVPRRGLLDFVIALGAVLRQHEITTILTSAPTGRVTAAATPIGTEIAGLTDVTILLRYVERAGEVLRCITVLRARGTDHDHAVRQVTIDSAGMHIGGPMPEISEIVPARSDLAPSPQPPSDAPRGDEDLLG